MECEYLRQIHTRIGTLPFQARVPSGRSVEAIFDLLCHRFLTELE
jgi:hypothetical protein